MIVDALYIHPVKSTRGHAVNRAVVEPWGLADDRRWMVVDADGHQLTAREHPALLSVTAVPVNGRPGHLDLGRPGAADLSVAIGDPAASQVPVHVWSSALTAAAAPADAHAWFSDLLGLDARLVWLDDPTRRPTNPDYSTPDDRVSFADGYPLLLATTSSLRRLNDWIVEGALERGDDPPDPLPVRRFRPSVVVDGSEPFAEDGWTRVRIGDVPFRVAKPCDRCVLTTIDPDTLARGKEPIRTLAQHRKWDGKVWFATNLIPDGTGPIAVGDPVVVLD